MKSNQRKQYVKIQFKIILLICKIIFVMVSCHSGNSIKISNLAPDAHQVTAKEVLQTNSYTYVHVTADNRDYWIAIIKSEVETGKTYYWSEGVAMKDFPSKELNRTFPSIYLVQDFTDQPITLENLPTTPSGTSSQKTPEKTGISIAPPEGGSTIAELYSLKDLFNGKKVRVRGEVVKFAGEIMDRNWVHIQDGTRSGDQYDLAITTQDIVKAGDIVVFEGTITLNRDFGAGYFYEMIMEDASLLSE
ncbi:MAG TPA: GW dipeptide domain-containing protein [Cyclobacteriaceae bacterium]|nr:GW dipeptide domain-containing protein [Cyclobacteriaceae bacterium]